MIKRIAKGAVIGAAAIGLLAAPAQASHGVGSVAVFTGTATLTAGLSYPVIGGSGSGGWSFAVAALPGAPITGIGVTTTGTIGTPNGAVTGGTLVSGSVVPGVFCGASGGKGGSGTIGVGNEINGTPVVTGVTNVGWTQSVASLIVFDGDITGHTAGSANGRSADPEIQGVVSAIPDPTKGSCSNGTAKDFIIVGATVVEA